jgi:hypothetical protein
MDKSTHLTMENVSGDGDFNMIKNNVKRVLTIVKIYHLEIQDNLFDETLINLINLMPELITIKLKSLSLHQLRHLGRVEDLIIESLTKINKINKLYIYT